VTLHARRSTLPLLGIALLAACSGNAPVPTYSAAIQEGQAAAYDVLRQGGDATSLGIALVNRDGLVWTESFGLADVDAKAAPTAGTMFSIGSVSKVFAAVAVMQLVEQGLVDLDEPLVTYVPTFRMADSRYADITVRMLLDHASGLGGTVWRGSNTYSPDLGYADEVLEDLAQQRLKAAPGYMSVYCNDGFTLVETLVRAVTGLDYAEYVDRHLFQPLGMGHSAFALAPFPEGSFARAYRGGVLQPQEFTNEHASGGVYTTPTDLASFVRLFLNGGVAGGVRVLRTTSVEEMAVDQTAGSFDPVPSGLGAFGLGWDSVAEPALAAVGVEGWAKSGGVMQYEAQILVAPREGLAVLVMGTKGGAYEPLTIAQRVMLRALAESGRIPEFPAPVPAWVVPEATAPAGLLASMAGVYAQYEKVTQVRPEPDGSLTTLVLRNGAFEPVLAGLRYRSDGWFTASSYPVASVRLVEAGGRQYLAGRGPTGTKTYVDQSLSDQKVQGSTTPLSRAWAGRLGRRWLVVNDTSDSALFSLGGTPVFALTAIPELPGLVVALAAQVPTVQVLDPSASDSTARMMVVIPGNNGRDLNDLDVVLRGGEEWVRWGSFLHRPLETVPVLPRGAVTPVAIGPEEYAEWRSVQGGASAATVAVSGATAWRFYDASFRLLGNGAEAGEVALPAGAGPGYLLVYGVAGGSVGVSVE
jgi:CubicO group peptidase (beta-lactamase class C family)